MSAENKPSKDQPKPPPKDPKAEAELRRLLKSQTGAKK